MRRGVLAWGGDWRQARFWIYRAIAGVGAFGIKVVAIAKVARVRGTRVFEEAAFGWTTARLLGLPAPIPFYLVLRLLGVRHRKRSALKVALTYGSRSCSEHGEPGSMGTQGFTGHEHLDAVALIHMNGRVWA